MLLPGPAVRRATAAADDVHDVLTQSLRVLDLVDPSQLFGERLVGQKVPDVNVEDVVALLKIVIRRRGEFDGKTFVPDRVQRPRPDVINLFTAVIYNFS